jgi:hypothetical protein
LSSDLYVVTCVHLFFFFFLHSSIERSFIYQLNLISQFRENLIQDWNEVISFFFYKKKKKKKTRKKNERKKEKEIETRANEYPFRNLPAIWVSAMPCISHNTTFFFLSPFSAASCLHRITYGLLNFFFTFSESPSSLSLPLPISVSQCLSLIISINQLHLHP